MTITSRTRQNAERAKARIQKAAPRFQKAAPRSIVKTAIIDFANPDSVRQFTDQQLGDTRPLDTLINNAGIMVLPKRETSPDGHELQFATNALGLL
jgi:NAD(P)-dependent dehydrogenase (short-subunit alcohol dehydrogenase family)